MNLLVLIEKGYDDKIWKLLSIEKHVLEKRNLECNVIINMIRTAVVLNFVPEI